MDYVKLSKEISYALRHRPEEYGLSLDAEGWVRTDALLAALNTKTVRNPPATIDDVRHIIDSFEKKRFEIRGDSIRATYGHSCASAVRIGSPVPPPDVLFHGTSGLAHRGIMEDGILPMSRQMVHLSSDRETAIRVGRRHDSRVVLLTIDAKAMSADGFRFYHSANDGTWLCSKVPVKYIIETNVTLGRARK